MRLISKLVSDGERWWKKNRFDKTSNQYEAEANKLYERRGKVNYEEAFKLYGKAKSAAEAKGLIGKTPSLLLKMGKCQKNIAKEHNDPKEQREATLLSSFHIHMAIHVSIAGGTECCQSQEWTIDAVKEALEVATSFFDDCLPRIEGKSQKLQEAVRFSLNTCLVPIQNHPFQDVTIRIQKEVAFLAFELTSEFLERKDFQGGRQHLQTMMTSIDKVKVSYALREGVDPDIAKELKALSDDYLVSCDIAVALEGLEAGNLIYSLAKKYMDTDDVEYALTTGWDALDKFKEVERLSQSTMDDVSLEAKAGQGFVYSDIFKMPEIAKKIFTSVVEHSAFQEYDWYQGAEKMLNTMVSNDPGIQKAKVMEELQPELERIRKVAQDAGSDTQRLIDELYRISPPIPKKDGTMNPKPDVLTMGKRKAIRKMIFFYHPDKIDKSNLRNKFLCEEIAKIFTEQVS